MKLSVPIHILEQQARAASRRHGIPLHEALDRIARREGFAAWSLLAARWRSRGPGANLLSRLRSGDLVLLGARPGQGKTLLGVGLAIEAMDRGQRAAFFTLDFTGKDVARCFRVLGRDVEGFRSRFLFDDSDEVSAEHVVDRLACAPRNTRP